MLLNGVMPLDEVRYMDLWIVSAILAATVILLITETFPIDLTAIGILVALMLTGILEPVEAVKGFANPAVVTVGAMFLVSRGMIRTGVVGFIAQKIIHHSRGSHRIAMLLILLIVAAASAFLNNTPVVVLFIPIILSLSCEYRFSPSKLLIPISYVSILAGTCTLIGTSTNIIISDLSAVYGYGKLGMFELSAVGVPIAAAGIAIILFAAPRLMPGHAAPICEIGDSDHRRYLAEIKVPRGSAHIDREPEKIFTKEHPSVEVLEVIRYSHVFYPGRDRVTIAADDLLLIKGPLNDLVSILQSSDIELPEMLRADGTEIRPQDYLIVELIVPPQSSMLGQRLIETTLYRDTSIHILGIKRTELHYTEKQLPDVLLHVGDILLIRFPEDQLERLRGNPDFIIVEDVHHEIIIKKKAPWAFFIFLGLIVAASTGLADILACALTAVFLMILTGCLQIRDAYRSLQANVLMLIVGTIALGTAMEETGAARVYAITFLSLFRDAGPATVLAGILLVTSLGTQFLSNNAVAVLLLPIAISTALGLGVNPKPFIMAVCFGASACFATPIGYQTNLLVYGPGSYRFRDYFKLGIPLSLMVVAIGAVLIPRVWPF
ncbi:MAG: SLC13 family permease [Desulfobacteraceae bacterium]|nr:MAG: SLC13 family permease [Desulfobacteraceae bacterium]